MKIPIFVCICCSNLFLKLKILEIFHWMGYLKNVWYNFNSIKDNRNAHFLSYIFTATSCANLFQSLTYFWRHSLEIPVWKIHDKAVIILITSSINITAAPFDWQTESTKVWFYLYVNQINKRFPTLNRLWNPPAGWMTFAISCK